MLDIKKLIRKEVSKFVKKHSPLPLGEGAVVREKRATNAGEGKTLSRIAKIRSRSLSNSALSRGERKFVNSLSWERGRGEGKDLAIADRATLVRNDENPQTVKNLPSYRPNVLTTSEKLDCHARPADGGNGARNDEICHPELASFCRNLLISCKMGPLGVVSGSHSSRKRCAFTLTEVIIVMLVIAVIVAVSIKATKAKLNHITSYTYYAAYSTINSVTKEMLKDFDADEENYGVVSRIRYFFASNFGILPAWAGCQESGCPKGYKCMSDGSCYADSAYDGGAGLTQDDEDFKMNDDPDPGMYPGGQAQGELIDTDSDSDSDTDTDTDTDGDSDGDTCPADIACGYHCSAATGYNVVPIENFSRECEDSNKVWSETACGCINTPQTVARTGDGFCKLFVSYANTSQLAEDDECKGDAIADDEVDFSDKEPDMILRNGMYLYNVSQDPQPIDALDGNSKGRTYTKTEDDGTITVVDLDEWGYTLYIDIDGARGGNGVLWEDVYPFYVTLSGKVIPAYDTTNAGLSGGDSKLHLQTSVADEYIDDATGHRLDWITKSAPFKTSACAMDYVKAATPYCSTAPAVTTNTQCATTGHDCRLKTIMPVKFF